MRTLGESRGKIVAMLTTENLLLGVLGLIPGLPLGYGLAAYFFTLFQADIFSFELAIFTRTYLLAIGLIILIVLLSQIPGIRQLNRIDLARVIKEQETYEARRPPGGSGSGLLRLAAETDDLGEAVNPGQVIALGETVVGETYPGLAV